MERAGQVSTLDASLGTWRALVSALVLNLAVSVIAWVLLTRHFGDGVGSLAYHFETWLLPTGLALAASAIAGLVCVLAPGSRRTGAGVLLAALLLGVVYVVWPFVYFVSLGS